MSDTEIFLSALEHVLAEFPQTGRSDPPPTSPGRYPPPCGSHLHEAPARPHHSPPAQSCCRCGSAQAQVARRAGPEAADTLFACPFRGPGVDAPASWTNAGPKPAPLKRGCFMLASSNETAATSSPVRACQTHPATLARVARLRRTFTPSQRGRRAARNSRTLVQ